MLLKYIYFKNGNLAKLLRENQRFFIIYRFHVVKQMYNGIFIPSHRVKNLLNKFSEYKFRIKVYDYISSILCLMAHEIIEISLERAIEKNTYIIDLDCLYSSINDKDLLDTLLTSCLFINNDSTEESKKWFIGFISDIKKNVINEQEIVLGPSTKQIKLAQQVKEEISSMIYFHTLQLIRLFDQYMKFSSEKTIGFHVVLIIYSLWLTTSNVCLNNINQLFKILQQKIDKT